MHDLIYKQDDKTGIEVGNVASWSNSLKNHLARELDVDASLLVESNANEQALPWTPSSDANAYRAFIVKKRGSSSTERRYARELFRFYLWLSHSGTPGLKSVNPCDIEAYLAFCMAPPQSWCGNTGGSTKISDPGWKPFKSRPECNSGGRFGAKPSVNTIQNTSAILKSFFSFLVKQGYLRGDPTDSISGEFRPSVMNAKAAKAALNSAEEYPCRPPELPEGLSDIQWQCLVDTIENMPRRTVAQEYKYQRARFVINLLYYTGLRSEEARSHSHKSLKFDHRYDCWKLEIYGKGSKKREIPVHQKLLSIFRKYRCFFKLPELPVHHPKHRSTIDLDDTPLFPSYKPYKMDQNGAIIGINAPVSERSADEWAKTLFKNAENRMNECYPEELPKTAISFTNATLHTIRHTRARHLLFREKVDLRIVQAFLGHTKVLTTQIYTEPSLGELYESAAKQ